MFKQAKFLPIQTKPKPKKPEEPLHRITMTFCPFPKRKKIKTLIPFNRKHCTPTWSPSWKRDTEQLQSFRAKQALHHMRCWTCVGSAEKTSNPSGCCFKKQFNRGNHVTSRQSANLFSPLNKACTSFFWKLTQQIWYAEFLVHIPLDRLKSLERKISEASLN